MILYHVTASANAEAILRDGFIDGPSRCGQEPGVWFSDKPWFHGGHVDLADLPDDDDAIVLELPDDEIDVYEWIDETDDKPYREWCIPASVVNRVPRTIATPRPLPNSLTFTKWTESQAFVVMKRHRDRRNHAAHVCPACRAGAALKIVERGPFPDTVSGFDLSCPQCDATASYMVHNHRTYQQVKNEMSTL